MWRRVAFRVLKSRWMFFVMGPSWRASEGPRSNICLMLPVFIGISSSILVSYLRLVRFFFIFYASLSVSVPMSLGFLF